MSITGLIVSAYLPKLELHGASITFTEGLQGKDNTMLQFSQNNQIVTIYIIKFFIHKLKLCYVWEAGVRNSVKPHSILQFSCGSIFLIDVFRVYYKKMKIMLKVNRDQVT